MLPLKSVSRSDAYFTRYGTAKLVAWLASASQDASYANFLGRAAAGRRREPPKSSYKDCSSIRQRSWTQKAAVRAAQPSNSL